MSYVTDSSFGSLTRGSRIPAWVALLALVMANGVSSCGGSTVAQPSNCNPGDLNKCACLDGQLGVQSCNADGTFDACRCSDAASATSPGDSGPPSSKNDAGGVTGSPDETNVATCVGVGPGNVLVLHGDTNEPIHPGYAAIDQARWYVQSQAGRGDLLFTIQREGQAYAPASVILFSAPGNGTPLVEGAYLDAERAGFAGLKPGLSVSANSRGCNTLAGSFVIAEITWSADKLVHLLVEFEQHCERRPPKLRGCIKFDAPAVADAGP